MGFFESIRLLVYRKWNVCTKFEFYRTDKITIGIKLKFVVADKV